MRKLLVFQHVPFEPLGTLTAQFKQAGFRIRYVNFDRQPMQQVDVARYHGLVILGGPMSADQTRLHPHLLYEQQAVREAVARQIPTLGICLGAQLIAAGLGGKTVRGEAVEYGWSEVTPTENAGDDPLFRHFEGTEKIYQWHTDTFTLPRDAVLLASSPACAHQAFRVGDSVYGLQFHLEADRALIERWLGTQSQLKGPEKQGVRIDAAESLRETDVYLPRATSLARLVFGAFIDRFYQHSRRRAHPSR